MADHLSVKNIVNFMRSPPVCWRTWIQQNIVDEVNLVDNAEKMNLTELHFDLCAVCSNLFF